MTIAETSKVYPNLRLGENVIIEDYCIVGLPFKDYSGEPTIIGDGAVIRSHSVIYAGNTIGANFQTGHKANLRELNNIGNDVSVGTLSIVEHHVSIGNGVRIHSQAFIPEFSILEDCCWIGPNVVLTNARFPQSPTAKAELKGPTIGIRARIGANSTILPGISVGSEALVGAGSVVTKPVSERTIVVGNPAKFVRNIHY